MTDDCAILVTHVRSDQNDKRSARWFAKISANPVFAAVLSENEIKWTIIPLIEQF